MTPKTESPSAGHPTGGLTYRMVRAVQGATQAPPRLAERDLIALMERHGIGTDATVAEHIQARPVAGPGSLLVCCQGVESRCQAPQRIPDCPQAPLQKQLERGCAAKGGLAAHP